MEEDLMGKMFDVEIYETGNKHRVYYLSSSVNRIPHIYIGKHYMKGRRIEDGKVTNPAKAPSLPKGSVSGTSQVPYKFFALTETVIIMDIFFQTGGVEISRYPHLIHVVTLLILLGAISVSFISKFTEFL